MVSTAKAFDPTSQINRKCGLKSGVVGSHYIMVLFPTGLSKTCHFLLPDLSRIMAHSSTITWPTHVHFSCFLLVQIPAGSIERCFSRQLAAFDTFVSPEPLLLMMLAGLFVSVA